MDPFQPFLVTPTRVALPSGASVDVPTCFLHFSAWRGDPVPDAYGRKAVLEVDGQPHFAELAVLALLKQSGWSGVWVDSYRNRFMVGLPRVAAPISVPREQRALLARIAGSDSTTSGCWDVFAWRDGEVMFAECKRRRKDRMQPSQCRWLESALGCGVPFSAFMLVEWDIRPDMR